MKWEQRVREKKEVRKMSEANQNTAHQFSFSNAECIDLKYISSIKIIHQMQVEQGEHNSQIRAVNAIGGFQWHMFVYCLRRYRCIVACFVLLLQWFFFPCIIINFILFNE